MSTLSNPFLSYDVHSEQWSSLFFADLCIDDHGLVPNQPHSRRCVKCRNFRFCRFYASRFLIKRVPVRKRSPVAARSRKEGSGTELDEV